MKSKLVRRAGVRWAFRMAVVAASLTLVAAGADRARAGLLSTSTDPASVVPLDKIAPECRDSVAEVIRDHTLHRKGAPETFPCNPRMYLALLNEPLVTLALWNDLAKSPVHLEQVGPNRYEGADGAGATGTWEFAYRSPKLHVLLCKLDYTTTHGNAHLEARIVLIVHTGFFREVNGDPWIQHDIEAFVKVDSKGWKAVARSVRPIIEKLLEDQVREAGYFVSLMGRLVATYPTWAVQVTSARPEITADTRKKFNEIVVQTKRPDASDGRPALADNRSGDTKTR